MVMTYLRRKSRTFPSSSTMTRNPTSTQTKPEARSHLVKTIYCIHIVCCWSQSWTLGNNRYNIKKAMKLKGLNLACSTNWSNWWLDEWGSVIRGPTGNRGSKWPDPRRAHITNVSRFWFCWPFTGIAQRTHTSVEPRNFHRQIHMCQHCCRQVQRQLCVLEDEALWQRLIQSIQLMWRRQDSCLMPGCSGVRPEGHRRIGPLWKPPVTCVLM